MARTLITPVKSSDFSTSVISFSTASAYFQKLTSAGVYVKTGGASHIDASRLIFIVSQNSSKCSSAGYVYIRAGSTAGADDFEPGKYSTARGVAIQIPIATTGDLQGRTKFIFRLAETARWKDSNGYINIDGSTKISSVRNANASLGSKIACLYITK